MNSESQLLLKQKREEEGGGLFTHLHDITVLSTRCRKREHTDKGHPILLGSMQLQSVCLSNIPVVGAITACKNEGGVAIKARQ